jgi:hypothetical protein
MEAPAGGPKKIRLLKSDTRQWSSGRVKLSVIGLESHPEQTYIVLEKNLLGRKCPPQRFNLRSHDWVNLKRLIDGDLQPYSEWQQAIPIVDQAALSSLIANHPDLFEKVLSNPNILNLSESSLESLDRIAIKIYEVKAERIDLIFKELSKASGEDLTRFSSLLEDLRLNQVWMMASLVHQKLKVIDLLESTCGNTNKVERDVHDIFDKNPWLVGHEIVQSDKPLSTYLAMHAPMDPDLKKRPDLIIKAVPNAPDIVLVELKAPGVPLKAKHVGQVLEYKALIQRNKPNVGTIHCFVFGYEKDQTFVLSKDVEMHTFSELVAKLRAEYREYLKIVETGKEVESFDI